MANPRVFVQRKLTLNLLKVQYSSTEIKRESHWLHRELNQVTNKERWDPAGSWANASSPKGHGCGADGKNSLYSAPSSTALHVSGLNPKLMKLKRYFLPAAEKKNSKKQWQKSEYTDLSFSTSMSLPAISFQFSACRRG